MFARAFLCRRNKRRAFSGLAAVAALASLAAGAASGLTAPAPARSALTALASASANLDQCANGPESAHAPCLNGTLGGTSYANWINGNVNQNKAHWSEGQFLPYRTTLSGLSSGDHTLVLQYATVQSSKHAIDYLGSYDATETTSPVARPQNRNDSNPCFDILGTDGCTSPGTPPVPASTIPVPPADLDGKATCGGASWLGTEPVQQPGSFDLFAPGAAGAALTDARYVTQDFRLAGAPGNCATSMSVTFSLSGAAPASGWKVVLTWGGHIASALDWGVGNSASSISGSPYHMSLVSLDGSPTGSQDRSLSASAVAAPPAAIATRVSSTSITEGGTVSDTATLSGPAGTVTGSVQYFLCSGTTSGCAQGKGTLVGSANLSGGSASLTFGSSPPPGSYCVGIAYVNDGNSFYSSTYSGSPTNECFTVTSAPAPVLEVTKTADHGTVSAGDQIGYVITVRAGGTGTAHDVTMTDTLLPSSGTPWSVVTGDTTGGWTCTISSGKLTCGGTGFALAAGKSASVHVVSSTSASTCGTVTNQAHVTATNAVAAGSASAVVAVDCPAIEIAKTPDAGSPSAGDQIGYTVRISNGGAGTARGVTMTDTLPTRPWTSWSIVDSDTTGGWSCSISSGTLTCGGGGFSLAPGASASVHVVSPTTRDSCETVRNTASVSASNNATVPPASASASIVVNCANISITKTADASPVNSGDQIGYKVTVTSNGAGTAREVRMADLLPDKAGLSWSVESASAGWSCSISAGLLTCGGLGTSLAAGGSLTVHVVSPTTGGSCGTLDNNASVLTANDGTAAASAFVRVTCPVLSVTKTVDARSVSAGDPIGFTVTVTNGGSAGLARGVTISDVLPPVPGGAWSVAAGSDPSCSITGSVLSCGPADLAAGASLTAHVTSPTTRGSCGTYDNTATFGSGNDGTGTSKVALVQVRCAQIELVKTPDAGSVSAGDKVVYTIVVTNAGPGTARQVTVTDQLPDTGTAWSADAHDGGWSCSISSGKLTCDGSGGTGFDLPPGGSAGVHVSSTASAGSCGALDNAATVTTSNDGPPMTASASVTVNCASIAITKKADAASVVAGDQAGFVITVTNTGAGTARQVTMTDPLPARPGVSWSVAGSDTTGGWSCSISPGTLTCGGTRFDLAPGASASVHIVSLTTGRSCGSLDNTASVSTLNDGSGTASDSVTVTCPVLSITKTADAPSVSAGDPIGYTITVTNAATAGTARGVTITDLLPAVPGSAWSVASGSDPSCKITGSALACGPVDLDPGASLIAHVTSPTTAASCGGYDNLAQFGSDNDGSGVSDPASVEVHCPQIELTKTPDAGSVSAGDQVGFTITATNDGTGTARDVMVTDQLPGSGTSWSVASVSAGWSCSISSSTLTCGGVGTSLEPGASLMVHVTSPTTKESCGTLVNMASVGTSNLRSAEASAAIVVNCPTIAITKMADAGSVNAGDKAGYTIVVTNGGDGTARDVRMTDPLPVQAGMSWSADSATGGWSCSISSGTLTCGGPRFDLAPGGSASVHVVSPTTDGSCGTVANTASLSTANDGSGTASDSVTVTCGPSIDTKVSRFVVPIGQALTDTATLTGPSGTVTGTVDFQLCTGTVTGCPHGSGTTFQANVPLASGSATSVPFGPRLPPGQYCVGLVYHNDGKSPYSDAYSGDPKGECFVVVAPPGPRPPTIKTHLSSYRIAVGGSVRDTATLTGSAGKVTGTVDFLLCPGTVSGCPEGSGTTIQAGVKLVSGSATSRAFGRRLRPGHYCVGVAYHHDRRSLYADGYSGSPQGECFTVGRSPVITTKLSRHLITAGTKVRDFARLHRVRGPVHGTVQYRYYRTLRVCKADVSAWPRKLRNGYSAGLVPVHGAKVPASHWVQFRHRGTFYWAAFYSGDSRNAPAASRCLTEVLRVRRDPTSTTTWLSRHVIWAGHSVLDWATVHARTRSVHGTVQFRYYATSRVCRIDTSAWPARPVHGVFVERLRVHGHRTPDTRLVQFRHRGTFYWAAFYSGDNRNGPSASGCLSEVLKVK